jgi:hypothetical protein
MILPSIIGPSRSSKLLSAQHLAAPCQHCDKSSVSVSRTEFVEQPGDYLLPKEYSALWLQLARLVRWLIGSQDKTQCLKNSQELKLP